MRRLLHGLSILSSSLLLGQSLHAQFVPVIGSKITTNGSGTKYLPAGQLVFTPALQTSGQAPGYRLPGGGQGTVTPVTCNVVNGSVTTQPDGTPCQLPDVTQTIPVNLCFRATLKSPSGASLWGIGYGCLQPTAPFLNLDTVQPNLDPQVQVEPGPKGDPGPQGPAGCVVGQTCSTSLNPTDIAGVLNAKAAGAYGDGVHDDTLALNLVMSTARSKGASVYIPLGIYLVSNPIDMRGLHVFGAGMYWTTIQMVAGVQKSVVLVSTNTWIDSFGEIGGWDGRTAGGAGYGFEATTSEPGSTAQLPYHMTLTNLSCQNNFGASIYLLDAAYTLVQNNDCHNSGGAAILHIDSHDNPNVDGFGPTTITAFHNTFSDTLNKVAPAILDNDCVNCRFIGNIMENTGGGKTIGPQNRSLVVDDNYEENTSTGKFWDFSGSAGIGLSMRGNRGGPMNGPLAPDLANWQEIDIRPNWFSGPSFGDSGFASTLRATSSFFDPVSTNPSEYIFNPGVQTGISQPIFSSGAAWIAFIHGTYVDYTGGVPSLPFQIVTSTYPSFTVGHTTITLSMSSAGALQGTVSANCCQASTVRILGWIDVYSDRSHSGSTYGLSSSAPIQAPGFVVSGNRAGSGSVAAGTHTITFTNPFINVPACWVQVANGGAQPTSVSYSPTSLTFVMPANGYASYQCSETDNSTF